MSQLKRLKNDHWINLRIVRNVKALPAFQGEDISHPPRVVINAGEPSQEIIVFDTFKEAQDYADEIGYAANNRRENDIADLFAIQSAMKNAEAQLKGK